MKDREQTTRGDVLGLLSLLIVAIFTIELGIMLLLFNRDLPLQEHIGEAVIDSALLSMGLLPVLYLLVYRPLSQRIEERDRAQAALRSANDELEARVRKRTAELAEANKGLQAEVLQRSRAEEQAERNLLHLRALRTIDIAIAGSLDLRINTGVILDQVMAQLTTDAAALLLFDPGLRLLEYAGYRGFGPKTIGAAHVRLGEDYAGRAAVEGKTLVVPDLFENCAVSSRGARFAEEGFVSYCAAPLIARGQLKGVLEVLFRAPLVREAEWTDLLESFAGQAAIAVDHAALYEELRRSNLELTMAYDSTIEGWARALDLRDKETEGHSRRVTEMTLLLATKMGISGSELANVRHGALLHDIGKMGIPDSILLKPGPLTDEEWAIMRKHPTYAFDMLSPIVHLHRALDIPHRHHEKWDGTGYPTGLHGDTIPLAARIFAVADVWDALTHDRPYRTAWPAQQARDYIVSTSGRQFDPRVVQAFVELELGREDGELPFTGRPA